MRGMMHESYPLMLNHLLATVFFKSDVILMEAINGVTIVGIYSTAYKWLDALNIIPAFFTLALLPLMSRQAHEDPKALARNYVFGFKSLVMVALPLAVVTTFIAPALIGVLGGSEFLPEGGIALQIMIWSIPLGWINSLTQYVLIALDRQRQITFAFVAAVSFNVGGNLIFLPQYSYRAAAVTTILSELALLIGFYYLLRKRSGGCEFLRGSVAAHRRGGRDAGSPIWAVECDAAAGTFRRWGHLSSGADRAQAADAGRSRGASDGCYRLV